MVFQGEGTLVCSIRGLEPGWQDSTIHKGMPVIRMVMMLRTVKLKKRLPSL